MPHSFKRSNCMNLTAQELIHKWLSELEELGTPQVEVEEGSTIAPYQWFQATDDKIQRHIFERKRNQYADAPYDSPQQTVSQPKPINLEQSFVPLIPGGNEQSQSSNRKGRLEYERRPRHKTKPDHYEYKGRSSHIQSKRSSQKQKKPLSKRSRKHTINNDFSASNVLRNRLTLNSTMNLGIFRKGKTSSPVKTRDLTDLSFSEMKFLGKRSRCDNDEPPACHQIKGKKRKIKDTRGDLQQPIPAYSSNSFLEQDTITLKSIEEANSFSLPSLYPNLEPQHCKASVMYCPSANGVSSRKTELTIYESLLNLENNSKDRESRELSQLSMPYTWSESGHTESQSENPWEYYMRQLLQFDLSSNNKNEGIIILDPTKRYWSLEELKILLEERERLWNAGASSILVSECATPHTTYNKHKRYPSNESCTATGKPSSRIKCFEIPQNDECRSSTKGTTTCNRDDTSLDPSPVFDEDLNIKSGLQRTIGGLQVQGWQPIVEQKNDGVSMTDFKLFSEFNSEMEWVNNELLMSHVNGAASRGDDQENLIAQALNAAYDVIVHSEPGSLEATDDPMEVASRSVSNESVPLDQRNYPAFGFLEGSSLHSPVVAPRGPIFPYNIIDRDQNMNMKQLPYEAYYQIGHKAVEPHDMRQELIGELSGFWRQNKLY